MSSRAHRAMLRDFNFARYSTQRPAHWRLDNSERWARNAACSDTDPDLFAVPLQAPPLMAETVQRAKAICAGCPVKQQCLDDALKHGDPGIWGGTTERERRELIKAAA